MTGANSVRNLGAKILLPVEVFSKSANIVRELLPCFLLYLFSRRVEDVVGRTVGSPRSFRPQALRFLIGAVRTPFERVPSSISK